MTTDELLLLLKIRKIVVQPAKYKPVNMKPVELEVLNLKRAIVSIGVKEGSNLSELSGILEFRGRTFTLSLSKGDCEVQRVVDALAMDYAQRYEKEALKPVSSRDGSTIIESTVASPKDFLDFLHLIKNRGGLKADQGKLEKAAIARTLGMEEITRHKSLITRKRVEE